MKKSFLVFIGLVAFTFASCSNQNEEELKKLESELMAGHDVVMPKTMKLLDLKEEILMKIGEKDSATVVKIASDLQVANDEMYAWMDEYQVVINDVQDEKEKLKRFATLKMQIDSIQVKTEKAMNDAKSL
ncbi:MAG: hypothetical protein ACK4UP_06925 [Spirosomataceae bacterium]